MISINRVKKAYKPKYKTPLIITGLLLAGIVSLSVTYLVARPEKQPAASAPFASVDDVCADTDNLTFTCYNKELIAIVKQEGAEKASGLVKQQYDKSTYVKSQCHQLMHAIGRAALAKYNYNLADVYIHGDHFCASGYFHGASEQVVRDKGAGYLINHAEEICKVFADKDRYSLDHYNCVHGLGHGLMEATNNDVFKAIQVCEVFKDGWELRSCDSGVFMQNIINPLSPDETADRKSKFLKTDDLMYPCDVVEEIHQWGCYVIQSSWALSQVNYDFGKVFPLCAKIGSEGLRQECYESIGRDASGMSLYNMDQTVANCNQAATSEGKTHCFIGAAKDYTYNDHDNKRALQLCGTLAAGMSAECNVAVNQYYSDF
jgi:hypothetical protein